VRTGAAEASFWAEPRRVTCLGGTEVVRRMASRKPPEGPMTRTKSKPKAITRTRPKPTKRKSSRRSVPVGASSGAPPRTRAGTKNAQVVAMLQDRAGTTIAAVMTATGWQQHSVRGFLAGVIRRVESFWDIRTKPPQRVPPPGPEQALRIHQNGSFSTTAKQERC